MSEENTVNIKQRIIGALVIVSLGVILIPLLLNGGRESYSTFDTTIPDMPNTLSKVLPSVPQPMTIPAPKIIKARPERALSDNQAAADKPPETVTKETQKKPKNTLKSTSRPTPEVVSKAAAKKLTPLSKPYFEKVAKPASAKINMAYTLQIASFSKKSNAVGLQNKLRKKKFKAYIESVLTTKGRIYRLRVGPYLSFSQIEKIKSQLKSQFKLNNTIIVKYKT